MGVFEPVRGVDDKGFFLRRDGLASRPMSYTFHLLPPRDDGDLRSAALAERDEGAFLPSMRRRRR